MITIAPTVAAVFAVFCALPASAVTLELPRGAVETARIVEDPGSYALPVERFTPDRQPVLRLEGRVMTRAWRLPPENANTLAVMQALRGQLSALGFTVLFDCETEGCGGFDFRFNTQVLPAPNIEVDLADFRFLAVQGPGDEPAFLGILISRSAQSGYVQIIEVSASRASALPIAPAPPGMETNDVLEAERIAAQLGMHGRVELAGVTFEPTIERLNEAAVGALAPLAEVMRNDSDLRLMLVGHTDDSGPLASNIALSRRRAVSVRRALIERYGIAPGRLEAAGAGFLSPVAPNTTAEGRARNRRVEAILR